jgi:DNA-binding transcriptional LysR family regulator
VLLTVAEELHFGRVAERLQINRSRVSQVINVLEARIGGRLFERTSRRVRLTPIGEQLQNEVSGPYRQLQDVLVHVRDAATGVAGTLRIGMYSTLSGGPHITEIVRTFETRHPGRVDEVPAPVQVEVEHALSMAIGFSPLVAT